MYEFKMPALGADMLKGILASWHVKQGDTVKRGEIVADVETDKGTIEVEVWETGQLKEILVRPGQEVPVGTVLAVFENAPQAGLAQNQSQDQAGQARSPEPQPLPAPGTFSAQFDLSNTTRQQSTDRHLRISPLARRLAAELGVDLSRVAPNDSDGTIGRAEVERAAQSLQSRTAAADSQIVSSVPASFPAKGEPPPTADAKKATAMRHAIAAAVSRSKREIPHYYLKTDVNMTLAMAWLSEHNARLPVTERLLPVTMVIKAVALTLARYEQFNGIVQNEEFLPARAVNLGVAISLRGGGLLNPVIPAADKKNLGEIMLALNDLVQRARTGKLRASDLENPSATLTNLGDTGVDTVFGVIQPPQVALIGVGRIADRPWAMNGGLFVAPVLNVTLAADHRVSDGHEGALFLSQINRLLQSPAELQNISAPLH